MANKRSIGEWMRQNIVTVIFIILCAVCFILSGETPAYVAMELVNRLARNAFIVLSLIIPIVAGMGINFAITIGAMAAQIAILWVLEWQIPGIGGFLVAALMTIPIATLFGFLIGKLLNKMKGQEMIGSMILGYFANGLYQLLFLSSSATSSPCTPTASSFRAPRALPTPWTCPAPPASARRWITCSRWSSRRRCTCSRASSPW